MTIHVAINIGKLIGWESHSDDSLIYRAQGTDIVTALNEAIDLFSCELANQTFILREERFQRIRKAREHNPNYRQIGSHGVEPIRIVGKQDDVTQTLGEYISGLKRNLDAIEQKRSNLRSTIEFTYNQWQGKHKHSSAYMAERIEVFQQALPLLDRWYANLNGKRDRLLKEQDRLIEQSVPYISPAARRTEALQSMEDARSAREIDQEAEQTAEEYFIAGLN